MTKYEAIKCLPVERFADMLFDMAHSVKNATEFKDMLTEEFPEDMIPALQKCSTGADMID